MVNKIKGISWKSVPVEGFPVSDGDAFSSFVGLEECTDYDMDIKPKNSKKKKSNKRKEPNRTDTTDSSPVKKIKLDNGFIVETCKKPIKPSSADNTPNKPTKTEKNKNIQVEASDSGVEVGSEDEQHVLSLEDMSAWAHLHVPEPILRALSEQGFSTPTRIQELTLPAAILGRRDILGAAETGSGKTLAFGIPVLAGIMELKKQAAAGVDITHLPYKKTSMKKTATQVIEKPKKKFSKNNKKNIRRKDFIKNRNDSDSTESNNEESDVSDDNDSLSDEADDKSNSSDSEAGEIENDIISKSKPKDNKNNDTKEAEENDSDNSDDYVHLSEMLDSDDLVESDNEQKDDDNDDDEETLSIDEDALSIDEDMSDSDMIPPDDENDEKSQDEYNSDAGEESVDSNGMGCVRVLEDVELPKPAAAGSRAPLYALVLAPTRELALQITSHLRSAAKYTGIRMACLVGGMARVKQERELRAAPELVVATPGRLWDLLTLGDPHLAQIDHLKFLVVDETDRMLERSHFQELRRVLARLAGPEHEQSAATRQTLVFSATLTHVHEPPTRLKRDKVTKRGTVVSRHVERETPAVKMAQLVALLHMTQPKLVDITQQNLGAAASLTECRVVCALDQKDHYLYYVLRHHPARTIVFCNSIGCVKRLAQLLTLLRCEPLPLHAQMDQKQRLRNLERFRAREHGVLVATDVAARGLDVPDVQIVVHYQVPRTAENYVHRSGRTARAQREGLSLLMMEPGEAPLYARLCRTLNKGAELAMFPVVDSALEAGRAAVQAARHLDVVALQRRRATKHRSWLQRAAADMDMLLDDHFLPKEPAAPVSEKAYEHAKKHLERLLAAPPPARGFSFRFPALQPAEPLPQPQGALRAMQAALTSGALNKEKRKSKNAPLLQLQDGAKLNRSRKKNFRKKSKKSQ